MEGVDDLRFSSSLRVTDRNLDFYQKFVHFLPEALPQNSIIVNVGGGENQSFEKNLNLVRPDVKIITLDPSLHSENAIHEVRKRGVFKELNTEEAGKRIRNLPNKENTLEAYGQKMPLKSNSVEAILDVHAASQWAKNLDKYKEFIKESMRVLRQGGKLYIGNVYFGDPIPGDENSEYSVIKEARDVFDSLNLDAEVFVSQDQILPEYRGKRNVIDNRVCAIVTK